MAFLIVLALAGGALVSLSRSLNGRLAQGTSPLGSSAWNHAVGFAALSGVALALGGLMPDGWPEAPWTAWAGGPLGVVFVALGSYLVARIGAALTAMLVIAGQMVSGVALDLAQGAAGAIWLQAAGVVLILAGVWLSQTRRP